jgi:hypothetical protein
VWKEVVMSYKVQELTKDERIFTMGHTDTAGEYQEDARVTVKFGPPGSAASITIAGKWGGGGLRPAYVEALAALLQKAVAATEPVVTSRGDPGEISFGSYIPSGGRP